MSNLNAFWEAAKAASVEAYGGLARFKSSFQTWLGQTMGRYGSYETDTLRSWALHFTLSRREFADLINAYLRGENVTASEAAVLCPRCGHLEWQCFMVGVQNGPEHTPGEACSRCNRSYYRQCLSCNERRESVDSVTGQAAFVEVADHGWYCFTCAEDTNVQSCESCHRHYFGDSNRIFRYDRLPNNSGYMHNDENGAHLLCIRCFAPEKSRCKPKHLEFKFPALNLTREEQVVSQDEIFEIATGGGDVSFSGLQEIKNLIANRTMGHSPSGLLIQELTEPGFNFDPRWITREGNMPKRLAKLLLNTYNLKLAEDLMSEIGNIGQRYTSKPGSYRLSITRNVNRPRSEFVNGDSCWWTNYWWSRCNLKSLGGFGLRTWNELDQPVGRAWMIPMGMVPIRDTVYINNRPQILMPTPETLPADAYIIFNAYGPHNSRLDAMEYGRMIGAMTGKSYRKITLHVNSHHMYINGTDLNHDRDGGSAVLVAAQEVCDQTLAYTLRSIPGSRCLCPGKPL